MPQPTDTKVTVAVQDKVLESILETLKEIKADQKEIKADQVEFRRETKEEFAKIRQEVKDDFRNLVGNMFKVALVVAGSAAAIAGFINTRASVPQYPDSQSASSASLPWGENSALGKPETPPVS